MKIIKMPLKYEDGSSPDVLVFSLNECYNWGGMNVCDLCNQDICTKEHQHGYMTPVLGSNAICEKCYKDFIGRGKLYEEDREIIKDNNLIETYLQFDLGEC